MEAVWGHAVHVRGTTHTRGCAGKFPHLLVEVEPAGSLEQGVLAAGEEGGQVSVDPRAHLAAQLPRLQLDAGDTNTALAGPDSDPPSNQGNSEGSWRQGERDKGQGMLREGSLGSKIDRFYPKVCFESGLGGAGEGTHGSQQPHLFCNSPWQLNAGGSGTELESAHWLCQRLWQWNSGQYKAKLHPLGFNFQVSR